MGRFLSEDEKYFIYSCDGCSTRMDLYTDGVSDPSDELIDRGWVTQYPHSAYGVTNYHCPECSSLLNGNRQGYLGQIADELLDLLPDFEDYSTVVEEAKTRIIDTFQKVIIITRKEIEQEGISTVSESASNVCYYYHVISSNSKRSIYNLEDEWFAKRIFDVIKIDFSDDAVVVITTTEPMKSLIIFQGKVHAGKGAHA